MTTSQPTRKARDQKRVDCGDASPQGHAAREGMVTKRMALRRRINSEGAQGPAEREAADVSSKTTASIINCVYTCLFPRYLTCRSLQLVAEGG